MIEQNKIKEENTKTSKAPLFISVTIFLLLIATYFLIPSFKNAINEAYAILTSDERDVIQKWVSQFGIIGPIVLILAMVVQMFMFIIPNVLLMMIAIVSYGPIWGSIISLIGVFASSSLGYIIGRYLGPMTINKLISVKTQANISQFIEDYGVGAIAITRLASISNDSLSFVAGILRMSYHKYILATMSGITPLIVLLAIFGQNGKIEKALIYIAAISMVLLLLYIFIDKRKKRKKQEVAEAEAPKV